MKNLITEHSPSFITGIAVICSMALAREFDYGYAQEFVDGAFVYVCASTGIKPIFGGCGRIRGVSMILGCVVAMAPAHMAAQFLAAREVGKPIHCYGQRPDSAIPKTFARFSPG